MRIKVIASTIFLFLLFAPTIGTSALETSLKISNTGVIDYNSSSNPTLIPADAELLWGTDWNTLDVPVWVTLFHDLSIENNMLKSTSSGGNAPPWGARSRVYLNTLSPLSEYMEYWVKAVFLIPSNYQLEKWLTFWVPLAESGDEPYNTFKLVYSGQYGTVAAEVNQDVSANYPRIYYDREFNIFAVEKGVPFEVLVHIKRDPVNGIIELWHNQNLVYNYTGQTWWNRDTNLAIVFDHYRAEEEGTDSIYQDSLEVWIR